MPATNEEDLQRILFGGSYLIASRAQQKNTCSSVCNVMDMTTMITSSDSTLPIFLLLHKDMSSTTRKTSLCVYPPVSLFMSHHCIYVLFQQVVCAGNTLFESTL